MAFASDVSRRRPRIALDAEARWPNPRHKLCGEGSLSPYDLADPARRPLCRRLASMNSSVTGQ